jgi:hypothetical protein
MTDKLLTFAFTLMACVALYFGFDTDGMYLQQLMLIFSGYAMGGLFVVFTSKE